MIAEESKPNCCRALYSQWEFEFLVEPSAGTMTRTCQEICSERMSTSFKFNLVNARLTAVHTPPAMRLPRLSALALVLTTASAYLDTSPFFTFSTSEHVVP
jgi:hypothetical protein